MIHTYSSKCRSPLLIKFYVSKTGKRKDGYCVFFVFQSIQKKRIKFCFFLLFYLFVSPPVKNNVTTSYIVESVNFNCLVGLVERPKSRV